MTCDDIDYAVMLMCMCTGITKGSTIYDRKLSAHTDQLIVVREYSTNGYILVHIP